MASYAQTALEYAYTAKDITVASVSTLYSYYFPHQLIAANSSGKGSSAAKAPISREEMLAKLATTEFDVLILGGGSTGCGAALDALSRGLSVAVIEKVDFGAGTSSASTKLLHGGVRYLQKAVTKRDMSQIHLVHEALHERGGMFKQAPHLTNPIPILTPLYTWAEVPQMLALLKLYDIMSGDTHIGSSYFISATEAAKRFPQLKTEGLVGAVVYYDGQFDDARYNVACATTAAAQGGVLSNYTDVVGLLHTENGRLCGAKVKDLFTGNVITVKSKAVVNATGHFADVIRKMDSPDAKSCLVAAQGTHIMLDKKFCAETEGLLINKTDDGRVVFLLPWQGCTLAGTTDGPCEITDQPKPTPQQVEYIVHHLNRYFNQEISVADVKAAWSGIRPLKKSTDANDTASVSREHGIFTSASGLMTIVGGKWTTYRKMSEDIINHVLKEVPAVVAKNGPTTASLKLTGAAEYNAAYGKTLSQKFDLPIDVAEHLNKAYGDQAEHVCELGKEMGLLGRLAPKYPHVEVEVVWAARMEMAERAVDVLARRTRMAFLDHDAAEGCTGRIIELIAQEKKWDEARKAEEKAICAKWLDGWSQSKASSVPAA
eukprot:comp21267_c0_seq1/m.29001 comp21267_c0_seq1/g.29001  ORF comp21267_c0_seq1/g.29001 comp21267_c0_seq1/m.29001 type:complete len:601 (-) comp21267_c0_seq1:348-2150(-)